MVDLAHINPPQTNRWLRGPVYAFFFQFLKASGEKNIFFGPAQKTNQPKNRGGKFIKIPPTHLKKKKRPGRQKTKAPVPFFREKSFQTQNPGQKIRSKTKRAN